MIVAGINCKVTQLFLLGQVEPQNLAAVRRAASSCGFTKACQVCTNLF